MPSIVAVSEEQERVIQSYVKAEERFWKMVKKIEDNAELRLAVLNRSVEVRHQRKGLTNKRGIPESGGPPDLSVPLSQAVKAELKAMEPRIRHLVAWRREQRRLAVGCGPVQIGFSRLVEARHNFRELYRRSKSSLREIAAALGISTRPLEDLLAGKTVSRSRLAWAKKLEGIGRDGELLVIAVRVGMSRKKFGWQMSSEQYEDLVNGRRSLEEIQEEILDPERDELRYARKLVERSASQRALSSKKAFRALPAPASPGCWSDGTPMISSNAIVDEARETPIAVLPSEAENRSLDELLSTPLDVAGEAPRPALLSNEENQQLDQLLSAPLDARPYRKPREPKKRGRPRTRPPREPKPRTSHLPPVQPDAMLAAIVGADPIPRTAITKLLWVHIKQHARTEGRTIVADDKLRALFDGADRLPMLELARVVSRHVSPLP